MTHLPKCRACKRRLKHPSPSGYGPVCERRINGTPPGRTPAITRPTATAGPLPGQDELPLTDQLELWSP